jgi:hypothetical protein
MSELAADELRSVDASPLALDEQVVTHGQRLHTTPRRTTATEKRTVPMNRPSRIGASGGSPLLSVATIVPS